MNTLIVPTTIDITKTTPGRYEIRRNSGEAPFALLIAPSTHRKGRKWHIHYRGPDAPYFDESCANVAHTTQESAMDELRKTASIASAYQLCLPEPTTYRIQSCDFCHSPGVFQWIIAAVRPFDEPKACELLAALGLPQEVAGKLATSALNVSWKIENDTVLVTVN